MYKRSQVGYTTDLPRLELPHEYLVLMDYKRELRGVTLSASRHAVCSDALHLICQDESVLNATGAFISPPGIQSA